MQGKMGIDDFLQLSPNMRELVIDETILTSTYNIHVCFMGKYGKLSLNYVEYPPVPL